MGEFYRDVKANPAHFTITYFNLWMLISSLFTSVGGIVDLYVADKHGQCRHGVEIAATAIQGVGVLFCLIAFASTGWTSYETSKNSNKGPLQNETKVSTIQHSPIEKTDILQVLILMIVNIVCLIMVVLILVDKGCTNFIFNAVYSIFGTAGGFIINLITSFKLQDARSPSKDEKPDLPHTHPHAAGSLSERRPITRKQQHIQIRQHRHRHQRPRHHIHIRNLPPG